VLTALLVLIVLYFLYVFQSSAVGWLGPDEPRYASIGHDMAVSGDWLTPRLWGKPWFEKPPLLYWLIGIFHFSGLSPESAARIPVALLSAAFLFFYFWILRRLFDAATAWSSSLLLATSAGWVAFSQIAVTDLPLAVTFSSAMLLGLAWLNGAPRSFLYAAALLLGFALLAKGLVALALSAPFFLFAYRRWKSLLWPAALTLAVALPWYAAITYLYGRTFLDDFFWKHHFQRLVSDSIQHGQPFWFYLPVLLAGLLPWTPLTLAVRPRVWWADLRLRFLLAWLVFGFLFFSASTNKLPGYLLPLFPTAAALLGHSVSQAASLRRILPACVVLLAFLPMVAGVLPTALLSGLSRAPLESIPWEYFAFIVPFAVAVWWAERSSRRQSALALAALFTSAGLVWLKLSVYPVLDRLVTARPLAAEIAPVAAQTCIEDLHRNLQYGLSAYLHQELPDCQSSPRPIRK
jgi:4-amino-4-deoxy-L-arabinose transferase-like glycosyltransferase